MHPAPNAVWQIDGTTIALADATSATVVQIIDDHSGLDVACHAASSENSDAAWAALSSGFAAYGHPACVLSDNGTAFSGKRRQWPLVFKAPRNDPPPTDTLGAPRHHCRVAVWSGPCAGACGSTVGQLVADETALDRGQPQVVREAGLSRWPCASSTRTRWAADRSEGFCSVTHGGTLARDNADSLTWAGPAKLQKEAESRDQLPAGNIVDLQSWRVPLPRAGRVRMRLHRSWRPIRLYLRCTDG